MPHAAHPAARASIAACQELAPKRRFGDPSTCMNSTDEKVKLRLLSLRPAVSAHGLRFCNRRVCGWLVIVTCTGSRASPCASGMARTRSGSPASAALNSVAPCVSSSLTKPMAASHVANTTSSTRSINTRRSASIIRVSA